MPELDVTTTGAPVRIMKDETVLWETAVTTAVSDIGTDIKNEWRGQIRAAGLGNRLAGAVRSQAYPRGTVSVNAAAFVYTNADDILTGHDEGSLITSPNGFYLAIPMEAAGKGPGGRRPTPLDFERRTGRPLRMVYRPGRASLLVAETSLTRRGVARRRKRARLKSGAFAKNVQSVPVFTLVPQVKLPKRLSLQEGAAVTAGRLDQLIIANYNRLD